MEFLPKRKLRNSSSSVQDQSRHALRSSVEAPGESSSAGCSSADEAMIIDSDDENDLPDPQAADDHVLKGVVAYVEVRTKMENRSSGVRKQLELLGAVVVKKFTNEEPVTHVIWKDGRQSTKEKAVKRGLHLVSVLWVDSCKKNRQRAPELLFPVQESNDGDMIVIPKVKRMKSMQPKSFEEDLESSTERMVRKRKKKETMQPTKRHLSSPGATVRPYIYVEEKQDPKTPIGTPVPGTRGTPSLIPDTPASMRACLDALNRVRNSNRTPRSESEKPIIGESPTFGGKSDVLQKKLSFSPSVEANSSEGEKTSETNSRIKKGRRSGGREGTAKKDLTKIRRLSLRIEKSLSEKETDDDFETLDQSENAKHIRKESTKGEEAQTGKNQDGKTNIIEKKAETNSDNLTCSHVEPSGKGRKKRKLLSTNTDVEPSQTLTEPIKSTRKEKLQKELQQSGKACRKLDHLIEGNDLTASSHGDRPKKEKGETTVKKSVSSELVKEVRGHSGKGISSAKKRKKRHLSSESSEDEAQNPTKKPKDDESDTLPPTLTSRHSLEDFVQNKHFSHLKSKQKLKKGRAASLSSLSTESAGKNKDKPVRNSLQGNKNSRTQSLTMDSSKQELSSEMADTSPGGQAKSKMVTKSRTHSEASKLNKKSKLNGPSLVMTSVHGRDQDLVTSVVKKLGGFNIEENVSKLTTHVVCGEKRRTLNVLRGIARGCWLMTLEWVLQSLEAEHWLPEEPFEVQDTFPAARKSRLERSVAGESYQHNLLSSTGFIFVDNHTTPPKTSMVELINLCGGQLCSGIKQANLCIGGGRNQTDTPTVSEKWLLDCISQHKLLPFSSYPTLRSSDA